MIIPEIGDYEVRRSLIRHSLEASLELLDCLPRHFEYLPVTTEMWCLAAKLWAEARKGGYSTASDFDLDADVILAAQSLSLSQPVVVATTNIRHLSRFVPAEEWQKITP